MNSHWASSVALFALDTSIGIAFDGKDSQERHYTIDGALRAEPTTVRSIDKQRKNRKDNHCIKGDFQYILAPHIGKKSFTHIESVDKQGQSDERPAVAEQGK